MIDLARPAEARGFVHKRIGRFIKRKLIPVAAGLLVPGGGAIAPVITRFPPSPPRLGPVPQDRPRLPPTPTITTPAERSVGPEFQAVTGAFGMPAMAPFAESRTHLDCPKGFVLGKDNLCYPKAVLSGRSKFRKWRVGLKPPISAADARLFRKLDAARDRIIKMAGSVDLVTKKKVSPK